MVQKIHPRGVIWVPRSHLMWADHKKKLTEVPSIYKEVHGLGELKVTELSLNQNQIVSISPSLAQCPRLKILRLEENCLSLDAIPTLLLTNSPISTLNLKGNLFSKKQFADCEGYDVYLERYTAVRRKMDQIANI